MGSLVMYNTVYSGMCHWSLFTCLTSPLLSHGCGRAIIRCLDILAVIAAYVKWLSCRGHSQFNGDRNVAESRPMTGFYSWSGHISHDCKPAIVSGHCNLDLCTLVLSVCGELEHSDLATQNLPLGGLLTTWNSPAFPLYNHGLWWTLSSQKCTEKLWYKVGKTYKETKLLIVTFTIINNIKLDE